MSTAILTKTTDCTTDDIELYSFDIFDTLITRKTATPQGIFAIMQETLLKDEQYEDIPLYIRKNFYDYRIKSEKYQYSYNNCVNNYNDCCIEEIYDNFKTNFRLTDLQCRRLINLEIQTEFDSIVPIDKNISILKSLIANNKRVILISDMYLSQSVIRQFLLKADSIFSDIKIYVSNEYKRKKRDGKFYDYVGEVEGVSPQKWKHIGDNEVSDFKSPLEKGMSAELYKYPKLKAYERYVLGKSPESVDVQISIGLAKIVKLYSEDSVYDLGASLSAPILIPYVFWMLNEAICRGYKRLYFIARDGYVLKMIADVVIKERNLPIETKYVYGSRLAWQRPSFSISLDNLKPVIMQYGFRIDFLSKILNIPKNNLKSIAKDFYINDKTVLDYDKRLELYEYLTNNKEFLSYITKDSDNVCANLVGYLKQEIDFSDDNFAFVDLSGSGVTQNCLASVINTFYPKPINSFYFRNGQYKVEAVNVNRIVYLLRNDGCALLELLARAPHGQTLGYKFENGQYKPILDDIDVSIPSFKSYFAGIISYVRAFLYYYNDWKFFDTVLPTYYMDWLASSIDKDTSDLLGSIKYSHAGKGEYKEVAPRISKWDAFKYLLGISDINTDLYKLSYSRSKRSVKKLLEFKQKHPKLRKVFFHIEFARRRKEFYIVLFGIKISLRRLIWRDIDEIR